MLVLLFSFLLQSGWQKKKKKWITFCGKSPPPSHLIPDFESKRVQNSDIPSLCRKPPFISKSRLKVSLALSPSTCSHFTLPWIEFTQVQSQFGLHSFFLTFIFHDYIRGANVELVWKRKKWPNSTIQIHGLSFGMTDYELGPTWGFQPWARSSSFHIIGSGIKIWAS